MANNQFQDNWLRRRIHQAEEHQALAFEEINELVVKERKGKKIVLEDDTHLIEFVSCSYLGLDMDARVIRAASNNIEQCGVAFHAARTRIILKSFSVLEELLNKIFNNQFTLTFTSLHSVHLGVLPLLGSGELPSYPLKANGPLFILDKTAHASIQVNRALLTQFGQVVRVDFTQLDAVEKWLKETVNSKRTPILIADSVGSMGGVTPISWLFEMSEQYEGYVYLDDAHGMSIYGENGCGYVLHALKNVFHPRLILGTTLGKAFGAIGGIIVLPTQKDLDIVKRFATTYVFGGPLPLSIVESAIASAHIHLSEEITQRQNKLWDNTHYFDSLIQCQVINKNKQLPLRGLLIGDEFEAVRYASLFRKHGFSVTTAMYPTVPKRRSLLRVALSAAHQKEEIQAFCQMANQLLDEKIFNANCA